MSQFVTIQVGQCGNQIGSAFWPLVLHEYGIKTSTSSILKTHKNYEKNVKDLSESFDSFFYVPPKSKTDLAFKTLSDLVEAKVKVRAVLIDMEDSVVSRFKHGQMRSLFDQRCTVTNYPGSGNNWATGFYTHGYNYYTKIEETIRKSVEKCDSLHGFLLVHSLGGGTGSGLGTATLRLLHDHYEHVDRFVSCVYPSDTQDVITGPYNALLATRELIEHATCVFPTENGVLQQICNVLNNEKRNLDQAKYNASCKPFQDMNSIIVNLLLHLTSGARFPGTLNTDMNDLTTNLVPYPCMNYISSSVSPMALTAPAISSQCNGRYYDELFMKAWSRSNQLVKVNPTSPGSVVIGAAHIVRGNPSLTDIKRNIEKFHKMSKFTSWSKQTSKVGLCSVPPVGHPASVLCLQNTTAMSAMFNEVKSQFDKLYKKKAHVHHYLQVDDFEEEQFNESRECVASVSQLYKGIENQAPINTPRIQSA